MIRNYFLIAYRNLFKRKFFSFINVVGLSAGMAVAILITLWIWDELSFDRTHQHYQKIAKVRQNVHLNGEIQTLKTVPLPLAGELRNNYKSDFRYIVLSSHRLNHILSSDEKRFFKKGVFFSPEAPEMLSLKMLKGNRSGLSDRSSILLSQSTAETYFGDADPLNKVMTIDNKMSVKVTGVYEDLPYNSTFGDLAFIAPFDLYLGNESWITSMTQPWNRNPVQLYVQVADDAEMDQVSARISNIILNKSVKEEAEKKPVLLLEPMSKWHLYTFRDGKNNTGSIRYVRMFGLVGIFVLLLACINFMNLSTARSEKRAREVGIRKAVGSLRSQIISQFFCESIMVSLLSFACSLLLAQLTLPFFNEVANKQISILWSNIYFWLAGIIFSVVTGIIAGSYPALYLSSFNPVKVLKGSFRIGRNAAIPRKVLVVLQFTVSVILIIGTIVVFRQVQFAKERPAGYDRNGLLLIPMLTGEIRSHYDGLKSELLKTGAITEMARSESTTTDIWGTDNNLNWKGKDPRLIVDFPNTGVSADYGRTVGWKFKEGRDFSPQLPTDSSGFILNEAAVKFMGLENPVGEIIQWNGKPFTVIGVIRDMIVESPYEQVRPSIYCLARGHNNFAVLKLNNDVSTQEALTKIEGAFKKFSPATPLEYSFIDEQYDRKFRSEEQVGKLAGFFSALAIFISCLGIFGMASFTAEQRSKEIGVRKVLGASIFNVWKLLTKEFALLVLLSLIIAIPTANYLMFTWLQNYHYRTNISWWVLAIAGAVTLLITLLTVSYQAINAALTNPVKSLRTE